MLTTLTLRGFLLIIFSFFIAFILSIVPLSNWGDLLRPQWVALVLIYWVIALPHQVGLLTAFILGLLLDALYGSLLGEHALALTLVAYFAERLHRQMRMFPLLQQAVAVLIMIMIYQALLIWVQGILGELSNVRWLWLSALVSMLLWPWLYLLLRGGQRKYGIIN